MTEVMQAREAYRVEQWRQLMQQRRESPLNNREFCAQQGISEKSYYYWLKKLRESAMERGIPLCGRRTDRIKALYFSGDGYVLLYKRLNNGAFQWPRSEQELRSLDKRSFRWLMEGLKPEQPKAIQKCKKQDLF